MDIHKIINVDKKLPETSLPLQVSVVWKGKNVFYEKTQKTIVEEVVLAFIPNEQERKKGIFKDHFIAQVPKEISSNEEKTLSLKSFYISMENLHNRGNQCEFTTLELRASELAQLFIYVKIDQPSVPLIKINQQNQPKTQCSTKKDIIEINQRSRIIKMVPFPEIESGYHYQIKLQGDDSDQFSSLKATTIKQEKINIELEGNFDL